MKHYKFTFTFLILVLALFAFVSCKDTAKSEIVEKEISSEDMEWLSKQDTISITLNSNDKMQFDKTELLAFEGQIVVLTLHHTGTMPVAAMGHNFVLIDNEVSISGFARLVVNEKDNEYIPVDKKHVLAHTDLIGGGESTTVTFTAPEKGTYDFLCSFPGHYSIMKGRFNVK